MKKIFSVLLILFFALLLCKVTYADELKGTFDLSNKGKVSALTDTSHYSVVKFNKGDTITISASETKIHGLYITWDCPVIPWTLTSGDKEQNCGKDGFLHEYVDINNPSETITITIPDDGMRISGIRVFGEGELPRDVQIWNTPTKADIMVVSSHADDEILFFGPILSTYSYLHDADVLVCYMTTFWNTNKVREHEKLDGLWESGIRIYPISGDFKDIYSETLAQAEKQYDYEKLTSFLTENIRRYKPQVVVTHDEFGEYGHGYHMLTFKAVTESVLFSNDKEKFEESATLYGTWDTPKTYIHLYKENPITLDCRVPIEEDYAGRTALDIAKEAYTKHVSQQGWWFYVSDEYKYSCAKYGLYRSTVGVDTENNMLCNIKTYKVQQAEEESRKAEQESIEQASREQESREKASIEQASREKASSEAASIEQASIEAAKKAEKQKQIRTVVILVIAVIAVVAMAGFFLRKK